MKRLLLVLVIAAAAAFAIWLGMHGSSRGSSSTVTALLPKETLAFIHVPDVNEARVKWHESKLYKLWREPAMQDFLQKPMARNPRSGAARAKLQEMSALGMQDAFLAAIAWENGEPRMIGGFRFKGSADEAEKIIGQWRARAARSAPTAKREMLPYEGHDLEVVSEGNLVLATVYDRDWFFAANDLPALKALLDRADGRARDSAATLTGEENFAAAFRHMPKNYAAFGYARLDRYAAKLAERMPPKSENGKLLRQLKSVAATTGFQDGQIRDVLFIAMPKATERGELTRASLALTTADSFLYSASFINFPSPRTDQPTPGIAPGWLQFFAALSASGLTPQDWEAAFGTELGLIGDWPANTRIPALLATLPVRDATKAGELLAKVTSEGAGEQPWTASEKDGVRYYAQEPANPMVPVAATLALSGQYLIAGLNAASVEAALARSKSKNAALSSAGTFQAAERLVPTPTNAFLYLDTALFYTRLDAAVRPMLIMLGAFVPSIAETVDLGKLPAAEVITKHLGPVVMSQSYDGNGYVADSIGPISLYQAAVAIAAGIGIGENLYHLKPTPGAPGISPATTPTPLPSPTPSGTP